MLLRMVAVPVAEPPRGGGGRGRVLGGRGRRASRSIRPVSPSSDGQRRVASPLRRRVHDPEQNTTNAAFQPRETERKVREHGRKSARLLALRGRAGSV